MPTDSGFQAAIAGMALLPLVAFDAALDLVLGLAFVPGQLDAVDAAVAHVDEVEIVDEAAEEAGAAGGVRPDAIALQRKVLLVGARRVAARRSVPSAASDSAAAIPSVLVRVAMVMIVPFGLRPRSELLASGSGEQLRRQPIPQGDQPVGFGDEEDDDERADDDALAHVEHARVEDAAEDQRAEARQDQRKNDDQRRAEERAADRCQAADDDDEQDLRTSGRD